MIESNKFLILFLLSVIHLTNSKFIWEKIKTEDLKENIVRINRKGNKIIEIDIENDQGFNDTIDKKDYPVFLYRFLLEGEWRISDMESYFNKFSHTSGVFRSSFYMDPNHDYYYVVEFMDGVFL